jgi:DNA-binding PadR family transcriptional regulator
MKVEGTETENPALLPLTCYATLGLLNRDEEYTAVEIQGRGERLLRWFYWAPALSHIRRELNRLDDLGYVEAREERQGRIKRTLKYRVTPEGERALREWAEQDEADANVVVKNAVVLRLWLGRRAGDSHRALDILRRQIDDVYTERDQLAGEVEMAGRTRRGRQAAAEAADGAERDQAVLTAARTEWHESVLSYCLRNYDHELRNARRLLKDLERLTDTISQLDQPASRDRVTEL